MLLLLQLVQIYFQLERTCECNLLGQPASMFPFQSNIHSPFFATNAASRFFARFNGATVSVRSHEHTRVCLTVCRDGATNANANSRTHSLFLFFLSLATHTHAVFTNNDCIEAKSERDNRYIVRINCRKFNQKNGKWHIDCFVRHTAKRT